jgi:hypothetical protein
MTFITSLLLTPAVVIAQTKGSEGGPKPNFALVKSGAECKSSDDYMNMQKSVEDCAARVQALGGKYFVYGTGSRAGHCWREHTESEECAEGWASNEYDFYKVTNPIDGVNLLKADAECQSDDDLMGHFLTLEECMVAVKAAGGRFFIYGKKAGKKDREGACFRENTELDSCPEGFVKNAYDFYGITSPDLGVFLLKSNVECKSSDVNLGHHVTLESCMNAVRELGGQYFIYGKPNSPKASWCFKENTKSALCPEGWENDQYDFFSVTKAPAGLKLVKSRSSCKGESADMGPQPTALACLGAVRAMGGKFFKFSTYPSSTPHTCFWQGTTSEDCPEGWQEEDFDFYKVLGAGNTPPENTVLVKSDVECKSDDQPFGHFSSVEECKEVVRATGGTFFIFGKGSKAGACYREHTKSENCPEGFENDLYDFYKILNPVTGVELLKGEAECRSNDDLLGHMPSLSACAAAAKAAGGEYFVYGHQTKQGACFRESTALQTCPEGWERKDYDFFKITTPSLGMKLIKPSVECKAANDWIGYFPTLVSCMEAVRAHGGQFFIYGKSGSNKQNACFRANTESELCPEGFEKNVYDFFKVTKPPAGMVLIKAASSCNVLQEDLGDQPTVGACLGAARAADRKFFKYARKAGEMQHNCFSQHTSDESCPEGWQTEDFDFYKVMAPGDHEAKETLIMEDHECASTDDSMGLQTSLEACKDAVRNAGGKFFIYGKNEKDGRCFVENTKTEDCYEGFIPNQYDFYRLDEVPRSGLYSEMTSHVIGLFTAFVALALIGVVGGKFLFKSGATPAPFLAAGGDLGESEMFSADEAGTRPVRMGENDYLGYDSYRQMQG